MLGCIYGMVQKTKTEISILQQKSEEVPGGQSHEVADDKASSLFGAYNSSHDMGKQKVESGI